MKRFYIFLSVVIATLAANFFIVSSLFAQSSGGTVTVNATVPAGASCGNGQVDTGEQCDDGNTNNDDGCSSSCQRENRGGGGGLAGCTDNTALNYDPNATTNNGSCRYAAVRGCIDRSALNYNAAATVDDGSCRYPIVGCTDSAAANYNPLATVNDGSCQYSSPPPPLPRGCTDPNALNYIPAARRDDGSCRYQGRPTLGCIDRQALNYNSAATADNGSCRYQQGVVLGCTDLAALNYNPTATQDNGSCVYQRRDDTDGDRGFRRLGLVDVTVWGAQGTVPLTFVNRTVTDLTSDRLTLAVDERVLQGGNIGSFMVVLASESYPFVRNEREGRYYVVFPVPSVGSYAATIEVRYRDGRVDILPFNVASVPYGMVQQAGGTEMIEGAEVTLYQAVNGLPWPARNYFQINPFQTGPNGTYAFIVPAGEYQLVVRKDGYREYRQALRVNPVNQVVNQHIGLIRIVPRIRDSFDPNRSLRENLTNITERIGEKLEEQRLIAQEEITRWIDNPNVEEVIRKIVAPAALGISAALLLPSLWSILWPLFRLLFLQPILLLGKRKRESWGVVYNSVTKLPVDLALVRLIDAKAKRVVQSRVTDREGRYLFLVGPGEYVLEVYKGELVFPSQLLATIKTDGRMVDIYHGEVVIVTDDGVAITPNIPLDPVGAEKTPRRIIVERYVRVAQHVLSLSGIFVTVGSLYIAPTWYIWAFLGVHLGLYLLFVLYVRPKKPKGWGIVYDRDTKRPVGRTIVRLFAKQYNKLVATEVTNQKGRYAFLAGPNEYYVTYEKKGYTSYQSDAITVAEAHGGAVIKPNVALKRAEKSVDSSTPGADGADGSQPQKEE